MNDFDRVRLSFCGGILTDATAHLTLGYSNLWLILAGIGLTASILYRNKIAKIFVRKG